MKPKILQAIREANPETITKRDFCAGCGIRGECKMTSKSCPNFEDCEPLELRHLLRAMNKANEWGVAVNGDGTFIVRSAYDENTTKVALDLTKSLSDNLDDEELCAFLFDLLVKE